MAPDDTPGGPNGQTTGTAPATPADPTSVQDPLKLAAQTRLDYDLKNGNTAEAMDLIKNMGVNPNALNANGTTALGDVNENANTTSGINMSVLNAPTIATPATFTTVDGGITTDPDLAAPQEHHHHHSAEIDPILPPDAAALGAGALDIAAVTAMEMGDVGLALRLDQRAEDLTEKDNNDQQNNDDGSEDGPSLLQQEVDTGVVVDGTISDVGINPDSAYLDDGEFQYGTDQDNIAMDTFSPTPSYFSGDGFTSSGLDSFNTGTDPFAATPNYFSNAGTLGPDPFLNDPLSTGTTGLGANSFSLDPLSTTGTSSLLGTSTTNLGSLNIDPITIDPLGTGATTLGANALGTNSLLGPTTLSTDPTATITATTTGTPATTTPATVALDTTVGGGPDPFAAAPTSTASLNIGAPTSSFLGGTTLSAYSPATTTGVGAPATTFGDLSTLSAAPGNTSVYGTSFFDPVSVASTIKPPANDVSTPAPAVVAASPRVQTSMSLS